MEFQPPLLSLIEMTICNLDGSTNKDNINRPITGSLIIIQPSKEVIGNKFIKEMDSIEDMPIKDSIIKDMLLLNLNLTLKKMSNSNQITNQIMLG